MEQVDIVMILGIKEIYGHTKNIMGSGQAHNKSMFKITRTTQSFTIAQQFKDTHLLY
jgi:hypothetical protein